LELPCFDFPALGVEELETTVGAAWDTEDVCEVEGDLGDLGLSDARFPEIAGRWGWNEAQLEALTWDRLGDSGYDGEQ
jgi:hypothetical protein